MSRRASRAGSALALSMIGAGCAESPPPAPAPPPPPRAIAPAPALERAVRACAFATSDASDRARRDERELAACVDHVIAIAAQREGACLLAAESALRVGVCLGRSMSEADAAALCQTHPGERSFCLGQGLVLCDENPRLVECGKDSRCTEARYATGLVVRACTSDCRSMIDPPAVSCFDDEIIRCGPGLPAERTRCPLGSHCVETRSAQGEVDASCERKPCVPGRARCDGSVLESCVTDESGHGSVVVSDCAAFGLSCVSEGTSASCVTPEAYGCQRGVTFCEGSAVRACPAGVPVRVRCEAYGLAPCHVGGDGIATCGPPVRRTANVR